MSHEQLKLTRRTIKLAARFARVDGSVVWSSGNEERSAIRLAATVNRPGTQPIHVESAASINPPQTAHVANKDLVGVQLKCQSEMTSVRDRDD